MVPLVIQYPLDPTGVNPNNLVQGEPQALIANRTYRAIAPNNGAFFAASMQVFDAATGLQLTDGTNGTVEQYYCCEYYELPSERYGQEIDALVIVKDPTVSNNVTINYQALGGPYSTSATAIIAQIEALGLDNRPVAWGDIIGKPSSYSPSFHLHDIGDVYGFEYVVHALDRIRDAIMIGDQASYDLLYAYVDAAIAGVNNTTAAIQAQLTAHIQNTNNPHQTTAAQLNAYTIDQVNAITNPISDTLNAHVANENNPHDTTAAQVGAWTIAQTQAAIAAAIATVTLGFTPVQQGGGAGQGTNKIYLGWDGSGLRLQVDSTDLGDLVTATTLNANVTNLNNSIATKQAAGNYAVLGTSVQFGNVTATGTIYCSNDIWAFYSDKRLKDRIKPIKDALKKLRQVTGVTYGHTPEARAMLGLTDDREYMGFLAQDWESIAPQLVGPAPFDIDPATGGSITGQNYLTMQYEKTVALITEALKTVDDKVDIIIEHLGLQSEVEGILQEA